MNNIPPGTQVVALVSVPESGEGIVHPPGSVGIVTRTPCGHETHFTVRFPDGLEHSFTRDQFDTLKHFQDAQTGALHGADTPGFDLDQCVIYRCVAGSRAHGLETDESDTDFRGVYLAPPELQWSLFGAPPQFEDSASQTLIWELQKFLILALKGNPNIIECLYSPIVDHITPVGEELLSIRDAFLSQVIFQTFNGYAMSQFKKIEQDRRTRGEVRWKHAVHLLRLLITGAAALREGRLPVRVESERERLLAVKRGEVAWEEVDAWRLDLHRAFDQALSQTKLPKAPDHEAANRFLISARSRSAGTSLWL